MNKLVEAAGVEAAANHTVSGSGVGEGNKGVTLFFCFIRVCAIFSLLKSRGQNGINERRDSCIRKDMTGFSTRSTPALFYFVRVLNGKCSLEKDQRV